jgi:hypothetical protein
MNMLAMIKIMINSKGHFCGRGGGGECNDHPRVIMIASQGHFCHSIVQPRVPHSPRVLRNPSSPLPRSPPPSPSPTLTQIPHPMQSSSEIQAILELGVTSMQSLPAGGVQGPAQSQTRAVLAAQPFARSSRKCMGGGVLLLLLLLLLLGTIAKLPRVAGMGCAQTGAACEQTGAARQAPEPDQGNKPARRGVTCACNAMLAARAATPLCFQQEARSKAGQLPG